ncbi:MAG: beta-N-acetylhexosaminidase [Clostridia bacterium]
MPNIIPLPKKYEERYGEFIINSATTIYSDAELEGAQSVFIQIVANACGYTLNTVVSKKASMRFLYDRNCPKEGYRIDCDSETMNIFASGFAGAFYAVQSLRQLLNADLMFKAKVLTMHAAEIEDEPRYPWRGIMLDESRFFFGKEFVKKLLKIMSIHKLNVFHWHLTDNVGWRIEIEKYPKLTEVGAQRKGTQHLAWGKPNAVEWVAHGGYYLKSEIREIVAFAKSLNIIIVPEIDMPAHFAAAIAAYPELSCQNKPIEPSVRHNDNKDAIACAGKDLTYRFIYDVIDEIAELFPAPYFHIGGDEANKKQWKKCPECQKTMARYKLKNEEELQGFFNNKIALYLKGKGKSLIGWNEILMGGNLENSAIVQYWTEGRDKNVDAELTEGRQLILSKHQAFYFDMPYAWRNLKATYEFEPEHYNLPECPIADGVLGVEATLWTEWVFTTERAEYQLFPRMEALAEVAWTPKEKRDYQDFRQRLKKFLPILIKKGITYAPESMVDTTRARGRRIQRIFTRKDAHYEYKKAMLKSKRYR